MIRRLAPVLAVSSLFAWLAAFPAVGQVPPEEGSGVRAMPAQSPHWVFVYSTASLGSFSPATVTIFDGDTRKIRGMLTGGLGSSFVIAPDHSAYYMADTFYSRGSRGERTDVVQIYDSKTLDPTGDVIIPAKRQLSAQDNSTIGITPDGKLLLVANMTPATSATLVDLTARKVVGEIEMTGCTEILVTGNRQFVSLCGDGSMMTTDFTDDAKAASQERTAKPFFDPDKDPVYALPAVLGHDAFFLSYGARIYPVDLSRNPVAPGDVWSLLSESEGRENWKPGGVQPLAVSAARGLLYVLMHRGAEWTHKMPGVEVWVFDVKSHKRVATLKLKRMADAIALTGDEKPLLVAVMDTIPPSTLGYVDFYAPSDGELLGQVNNFPALFEHVYVF